MVTYSDLKRGTDDNGSGSLDYYTASVQSAQDYYPYGMLLQNRSYSKPPCATIQEEINGKFVDDSFEGAKASEHKNSWTTFSGVLSTSTDSNKLTIEVDSSDLDANGNYNTAIVRQFSIVNGSSYTIEFDLAIEDSASITQNSLSFYCGKSILDSAGNILDFIAVNEIFVGHNSITITPDQVGYAGFGVVTTSNDHSEIGMKYSIDNFTVDGNHYVYRQDCSGTIGNNLLASDYRFGFNGMEKDSEVSGEGNSYTTFYRSYDVRLGRWKSIDPKTQLLPWYSPYSAFNNNPVSFNDPRGDFFPVPVILAYLVATYGTTAVTVGGVATIVTVAGVTYYVTDAQAREAMGYYALQLQLNMEYLASSVSQEVLAACNSFIEMVGTGATLEELYEIFDAIPDEFLSDGILVTLAVEVADATVVTIPPLIENLSLLETIPMDVDLGELTEVMGDVAGALEDGVMLMATATVSEIQSWVSTEPNAQGREKIDKAKEMMKENDPYLYLENVYTTVVGGITYILDGHHRVEAAKELNEALEYVELTIDQALEKGGHIAEKVKEIIK